MSQGKARVAPRGTGYQPSPDFTFMVNPLAPVRLLSPATDPDHARRLYLGSSVQSYVGPSSFPSLVARLGDRGGAITTGIGVKHSLSLDGPRRTGVD